MPAVALIAVGTSAVGVSVGLALGVAVLLSVAVSVAVSLAVAVAGGSDVLVAASLGSGVTVGGSGVGVGRSVGAGVALGGSTGGVASCAAALSVISRHSISSSTDRRMRHPGQQNEDDHDITPPCDYVRLSFEYPVARASIGISIDAPRETRPLVRYNERNAFANPECPPCWLNP
jgi:hypothetical protein